MAIEFFPCYFSYARSLNRLSDQEVGRLFRALINYAATGEKPDLTGREVIAFDFIADDIDRAREQYDHQCNVNAENGKKGGRPKKPSGFLDDAKKPSGFSENRKNQMVFSETKKSQSESKRESNLNNSLTGVTAHAPACACENKAIPSLDQVREYCAQRKNRVNPQRFHDYYTAHGWDGVVDWQAAVRSWENNGIKDEAPPAKPASYDIERAEARARAGVPELKKRGQV